MAGIWKTPRGGEAVRARYAQFLARWPVANTQVRLPTSQGETFVVVSGPSDAPPVLLLHGGATNSASWMGDVGLWSQHFRTCAVDMIGEPGFSAPARPALASDAYAVWLDEVLAGLGVQRAALIGISLGGWLALDYATRRPERVTALALLCPAGLGPQRNVLLWAAPLMLLGGWGRRIVMRKLGARALGEDAPPAAKAFGAFVDLTNANFRPRKQTLPRFSDTALKRIDMPVLAILGAKDAMLDMAAARARLTATAPQADVRWLPDAGHFLMGHGAEIDAFLRRELAP